MSTQIKYDVSVVRQALAMVEDQVREGSKITKPEEVYYYLRLAYGTRQKEIFGLILLDHNNKIMKKKIIATGIEDRCHIYVKELIRYVLKHNSTGVILFHNHPSDNPTFSPSDVALTKRLKLVFDELEIRLLDHILITKLKCLSMVDEGMFTF